MPKKAGDAAKAGLRDRKGPLDYGRATVEAWLTNERVNQTLLDLLDPRIWDKFPPSSKRRNLATTFAHLHNVRCMRLKMSKAKVPARLDRATVTIAEARQALTESARAVAALIEDSIFTGGHVRDYRPDVVALVCSSINHEAHHRGQVCLWARELGSPITPDQQFRLWGWDKHWRAATT